MSQTGWQSLSETVASTAIGFAVSWAATPAIFWAFDVPSSGGKDFGITVAFTVLSLARGWCVRRGFNRLHRGTP